MVRGYKLLVVALPVVLAGCWRSQTPTQLVETGNRFYREGKLGDAIINYRKALQKDPSLGEAYFRLGLAQWKQSDLPEAFRSLSRAVALMEGRPEPRIELANICLAAYPTSSTDQQNQIRTELLNLTKEFAGMKGQAFQANRLAGYVALINRKPDEASQAFRTASSLLPDDPEIVLALAESLMQSGKGGEGEALSLRLIEKNPDFGPVYDGLSVYYLSNGQREKAEQILVLKAQRNPDRPEYTLQLADYLLKAGKRADADARIKALLDARDRFPQIYRQVGDFYHANGDVDRAAEILRQGASLYPKESVQYDGRLAAILIAAGRWVEARNAVEALLARDPRNRDGRKQKALIDAESGLSRQLDDSIASLREFIAESPSELALRIALGRAYLRKGDIEAARRQFQDALRVDNGSRAARMELTSVDLAGRHYDEAVRNATQMVAASPNDLRARMMAAAGLIGMKQYGEAEAQLQRGLADQPGNPDFRLELGFVDIAQKKYDEANGIFAALYHPASRDLRPLAGLVQLYLATGKYARATTLLNSELTTSPNRVGVEVLYASAAIQKGDRKTAIEQLEDVAAHNFDARQVRLQLADLYQLEGNAGRALDNVEAAARSGPPDADVELYRGYMLEQLGRDQDAAAAYEQSLRLNPRPLAMNNLAFRLAEEGKNLDRALDLAKSAVHQTPRELDFMDTLGYVYLKKNMSEAAESVFNGLVTQDPKNPVYRMHLAMALEQERKPARAENELQTVLAANPSPAIRQRVKALITDIEDTESKRR